VAIRAQFRGVVVTSFRLGLLLSAVVGSAVYEIVVVGFAHPADLFLSWAVDACAWAWLWAASEMLARRSRHGGLLAGLLFYPLFYFSFGCSFAHSFYFESAAERRFSLLDIDLSAILYFFTHVLPLKGWAVLFALLAVVHAGAMLLRRRPLVLSPRTPLSWLLCATLVTSVVGARAERVPSPLVDIASDFWELLTTPRIMLDRSARPGFSPGTLDKSANNPLLEATPFKKVLVFVMETTTADKLAVETAALEPSTFLRREREHFHRYLRYYPNNQDSRTGMLDMLMSRLVPYEAYSESDCDHYSFLGHEPSLVDRMNALGYGSAYALSQADVEIVVGDLAWKQVLSLSESEVRASAGGSLCFLVYDFEHGCEDRALLPKVLDFLDHNERAFLYQEMIWGHDIEYNRVSGKTNAQYYSAYVDAVVAHLAQRGELDDTLVVLTSDHGFRDKAQQRDPDVYHIPLFFYSTRFAARDDARLFSHVDFKDILFDELAGRVPAEGDPFVMVVGPTGTSMVSVLTKDDQFMLLKQRGDRPFLLRYADLGFRPHALDSRAPAAYFRLFDDYRRSFDARGRGR
jgi:hypothetical protein